MEIYWSAIEVVACVIYTECYMKRDNEIREPSRARPHEPCGQHEYALKARLPGIIAHAPMHLWLMCFTLYSHRLLYLHLVNSLMPFYRLLRLFKLLLWLELPISWTGSKAAWIECSWRLG